ncbi:unnamed protein product [marine sediment metagenome]|uniref:Uncharacterized protein n=1 Tax=marine sediment metagenome TaxID=412755 RepID=X1A1C3_9ZZZZ
MVVLESEQLSIIKRIKCYISHKKRKEIRDKNLPLNYHKNTLIKIQELQY